MLSEFHEMRQPFVFSAIFHIVLILIGLFGLQLLPKKKLEMPIPISVSMVTKPSDMARTNNVGDPSKDEDEEPPKQSHEREPAKPATSEPPPPPPPPVEQKVEAPPPPPEKQLPPPPPAPVPMEKPAPPLEKLAPVQPPQHVQVQPPQKLPPLQQVKVAPPKPAVDPNKSKQLDTDFNNMLQNLTPVDKADQVSKDKPVKAKPRAAARAQVSDAMTADEMAIIRERLKVCWLVPAGVMDADRLVIQVVASYNENKTLAGETLVDTDDRYNHDPSFRAAADSALRALRNPACNPLPWPDGKYADWQKTEIDFDPKMLASE